MKKFIITLVIVAILGVAGGYFVPVLLEKDTEPYQQMSAEDQQFNKNTQFEAIENLMKTYIVSSVKYDWDTIKLLSTGQYKQKLTNEIIPASEKGEKPVLTFNPRSMKVDIESINTTQSIVNVAYVLGQDETNYQQEIQVYLGRENNQWKIISVEQQEQ